MKKSAEYILSVYSIILSNSLEKILNVGYSSKDGTPIPSFDENILNSLCMEASQIFQKESNVLNIEGDFIIVGDIHGSLHDLLRIINYVQKNDIKVLFLGDYVNRGSFSLECMTLLFALKVMDPNKYFLLRGNHEFDSMCVQYGFKNEILNYHDPKKVNDPPDQQKKVDENGSDFLTNYFKKKEQEKNGIVETKENNTYNYSDINCYRYSEKLYQGFIYAFSFLPICAVVNNTNFCIHGGLSPLLDTINNIKSLIKRPVSNYNENTMLSDILWSDPSFTITQLFDMSPRGRGYLFSRKAVINFLNQNSLKRIFRGHQCVMEGSVSHFDDKLITVFSASSYDKDMNNNSGIVKLFQKDDKIECIVLPPIPRLKKSDAIYYKVQKYDETGEKSRPCFTISHPQLSNFDPNKNIKQIRSHLSTLHITPKLYTKPAFVTSSRKATPVAKKTFCAPSLSMNNISDRNKPRITKNYSVKAFLNENSLNSLKL